MVTMVISGQWGQQFSCWRWVMVMTIMVLKWGGFEWRVEYPTSLVLVLISLLTSLWTIKKISLTSLQWRCASPVHRKQESDDGKRPIAHLDVAVGPCSCVACSPTRIKTSPKRFRDVQNCTHLDDDPTLLLGLISNSLGLQAPSQLINKNPKSPIIIPHNIMNHYNPL